MAPMFASADIAALVSAFEPRAPTRQQASVVSNRSGDALLRSRHILAQFRILLQTSASRIKLSDLPARLDLGTADWVLESYGDALYYGIDSQTLLPDTEVKVAISQLETKLRTGVQDTRGLCSAVAVDSTSLENLLGRVVDHEALRYYKDDANGQRYVYTQQCADDVEERIRTRLTDTSHDRINVSELYPSIPIALLRSLAEHAMACRIADGAFDTEDRILSYVPVSYVKSVEERKLATRKAKVDALAAQLHDEGFCRITDAGSANPTHLPDAQPVRERYEELYGEPNAITELSVQDDQAATLLAVSVRVEEAIADLKNTIKGVTATVWRERQGSENVVSLRSTIERKASEASTKRELAALVLQSDHHMEIIPAIDAAIDELEAQDNHTFALLTQEGLLAPSQLYMNGRNTVTNDTTLNDHLSEFLAEHFQREVLPPVFASLREQRLLLDKARRRDVEKLQQTTTGARIFVDIHNSVFKLARKHKIEPPDASLLWRTKQQTLQQRAKALRSMKRGSDLLQNLLWILLARDCDGLFVSPGRDTSRMIKLYLTVGDAGVGRQLEEWRDLVKAGKEGRAELDAMRELGLRTIEEGFGPSVQEKDA